MNINKDSLYYWNDIELAPKDGTRLVLLYKGKPTIGFWSDLYNCWYMEYIGHLNGLWKPTVFLDVYHG